MELIPNNGRELINTISTFSGVDQGLINEYCTRIQKILDDLSARGEVLTTAGAAAGENAVQRIIQFISEGGDRRDSFITDMDRYIAAMQANRSVITQVPRDIVQVYGKAKGTGVITMGSLYAITWWNFTSTLSTLLTLAASNPLSAAVLGGITTLKLQDYSLIDYLKLAFMERPEFSEYNDYNMKIGLQHITANTPMENSRYLSYFYSFIDAVIPPATIVADGISGKAVTYADRMAFLDYERTVVSVDQLFNARDQFLNVTLVLTSLMIVFLVILWGARISSAQRFRKRKAGPNIEMLQSPMGRVPRRRSRSRRMNTAVKRKGSPKRRKSTRRKSRSPKRKSKSRRRKSRRKSKTPKRKSKSRRRKSRRKSKSKRRKSRRKSKTPKRKSKSKRRKSRRKSKSPKRKSTRKGQVRKTSRRAYMDIKTKPRRKSRSRRRKDMM